MDWILSEIPRKIAPPCVPLLLVGTEYKKKHAIHRLFERIAISLVWGENMKIRLENQYRVEEFTEPVCVIALPGDLRKMIPVRPFHELYFVYHASALPHLLPDLPKDLSLFERSILLRNVPAGFHLLRAAEALLTQKITPEIAVQLDLIGAAVLAATFRCPQREISREEMMMSCFRNYLRQHYREEIDWNNMARDCGAGFQTFRKIWRKYSSLSPHRTVLELRNSDACNCLSDLSLSISEIAVMLGYSDPHYFSRCFRKWNGITPSEYRRRLIGEKNSSD